MASSCRCCEFQETSLEKYPLQSTYIPSFSEYHSEVSSDVLSFLYNPTISYVYLRLMLGMTSRKSTKKLLIIFILIPLKRRQFSCENNMATSKFELNMGYFALRSQLSVVAKFYVSRLWLWVTWVPSVPWWSVLGLA